MKRILVVSIVILLSMSLFSQMVSAFNLIDWFRNLLTRLQPEYLPGCTQVSRTKTACGNQPYAVTCYEDKCILKCYACDADPDQQYGYKYASTVFTTSESRSVPSEHWPCIRVKESYDCGEPCDDPCNSDIDNFKCKNNDVWTCVSDCWVLSQPCESGETCFVSATKAGCKKPTTTTTTAKTTSTVPKTTTTTGYEPPVDTGEECYEELDVRNKKCTDAHTYYFLACYGNGKLTWQKVEKSCPENRYCYVSDSYKFPVCVDYCSQEHNGHCEGISEPKEECDDLNHCTEDVYQEGKCRHIPICLRKDVCVSYTYDPYTEPYCGLIKSKAQCFKERCEDSVDSISYYKETGKAVPYCTENNGKCYECLPDGTKITPEEWSEGVNCCSGLMYWVDWEEKTCTGKGLPYLTTFACGIEKIVGEGWTRTGIEIMCVKEEGDPDIDTPEEKTKACSDLKSYEACIKAPRDYNCHWCYDECAHLLPGENCDDWLSRVHDGLTPRQRQELEEKEFWEDLFKGFEFFTKEICIPYLGCFSVFVLGLMLIGFLFLLSFIPRGG